MRRSFTPSRLAWALSLVLGYVIGDIAGSGPLYASLGGPGGGSNVTATQGTTPWVDNVTQFGGTNVSTGTGAGGLGIPRVTISNDSSLAANQSVNVAQVNGVATTVGNGVSGTGVQRVTLASDSTGQVTLATGANVIGALSANQSVNEAQVAGTNMSVGNGISGLGVQRVTLASDSTGQVALATGANVIGALTANQSINLAQVNGIATTTGNGISGTGVQRVTLASDSTGQVSLATGANVIGSLTANQSVNTAQMNGVAVTMGNGIAGTGVQRVTLASDSTGQVTLATGANTIGALTANQSVNIAQMNGVATTTGNGVAGTGVQRVAIASDNTAFTVNAAESGTWTVQPGNTANTTAWLTDQAGRATVATNQVTCDTTVGGVQFQNNTVKAITVKNPVGGSVMYVGVSGVTTTTGFQLAGGETISLPVTNTNKIYCIIGAGSQVVSWIATN